MSLDPTFEDICLAITELHRAQLAHDEALGKYQGHSWGWAGQDYHRAVNHARINLQTALTTFIDARVAAVMAERSVMSDVKTKELP